MSRKILICEFDIFKQVGGGQTVYQNIIRNFPSDTFYYFSNDPVSDPQRAKNVVEIPFRQFYEELPNNIPEPHGHFFFVYLETMNMARSLREAVGEVSLDVVDTPDYRQNGLFLRNTLEAHGISVGTVALALHGTLSSAFFQGWPWTDDPHRSFAELRQREHLQFRTADARYAISSYYADTLQRYAKLPINMLDPLVVIRATQPSAPTPERRAADLVFIGRRERRKGPDLFLDIAWWLPQDAYRRLILIGGDGHNHQGTGSQTILEGITRRRRLSAEFIGSMNQSELQGLTQQKSLVFVPSRYDQFNLVALEALLDGCPTVVSRNAGVARFIEQRLPELSWLLVGLTCDRAAGVPIGDILRNYDDRRQSIVEAVDRASLVPDRNSLQQIYQPANRFDRRARAFLHDLADRFSMNSITKHHSIREQESFVLALSSAAMRTARNVTRPMRRARLGVAYVGGHTRNLLRAPRFTAGAMARIIVNRGHIKLCKLEGRMAQEVAQLRYAPSVRRNILTFGERSTSDRVDKLRYLSDVVTGRRLDRTRYFREMIRLERLRGNDLIAATYALRLIRWHGNDNFRLLGFIQETLREAGFAREAEAAQAMYGSPAQAEEASRAFLDDQLRRHRTTADRPWEVVEDHRGGQARRVSIVVSLYNAATKLPTFWSMLQQQRLVQSGGAEIVLVDSGSPANEYEVFQQLYARSPLPVVYARSKNRETIQTAWNRGIKLSSGAYLAFLGVDEGVHPECFEILAGELDRNSSIDWVIANSVVTEVDREAMFARDIMLYDRTGYRQDWHYLDTTFLSYVGGLYRRSIHDKLGYYDETFRAAGDTEFKNRILPYIKSKFVPRPLGVFNNYPEERTTQHPRAEIEDLRAWYLHRTPAGVAYAFDNRPAVDAVELLKDTLGYRKCYCLHTSTDIDLADSLARYLARRSDAPPFHGAPRSVHKMLELFRTFERLPHTREAWFPEFAVVQNYRRLRGLVQDLARELGREAPAAFDVFNDNRYEQHWWSWST